jgi:hypothetical protein
MAHTPHQGEATLVKDIVGRPVIVVRGGLAVCIPGLPRTIRLAEFFDYTE